MFGNLIEMVRSRPAFFLAAALIAILLVGLFGALHSRQTNQSTKLYTNQVFETSESVVRKIPPLPKLAVTQEVVRVVSTNVQTNPPAKPIPPLSIHVDLPADTNPPPLSTYAPMGRLVQCQLVNTVDSGANDTPIIALVTQDLWHDGNLVIPTGAEIHGRAQVDTLRERIISSGTWTIVRQTGEELLVKGIALDREFNEKSGTWGITDGSPGLAGQVIRSQSMEEIKLFAATMLSGIASGLEQSQTTIYGTQVSATARNAALNGTSQVLNTYAQQILETIKKQGVFVRVAAGKQFYLYVTQTIDLSKSKVGNMRVVAWPAEFGAGNHSTNHEFSLTPHL
ncbi:MAG: hypothetical protein C5B50_05420 [Verrucomicrobia bacterium]|nr:MAG: hypothetical protein C5B50_05420 [Verrucomicrobiota bacterium]